MPLDENKPAGDDLVSELDTYGQETRVAVNLNTTHRSSDGSDHTYIDQDVTSGSAPNFLGTYFSQVPDGALSSGATVTSAGAGDSGKLVKLDSNGLIDSSLIGSSILVTDLDVTGLTVSELLRVNSGGTAVESSGKTVPTGDIVGTTDIQTLTNKTLTSPVFTTPQINNPGLTYQYIYAGSAIAADRTVTLPLLTGNDTFVFQDHTQTLTGKTLTAPTLTTPVIADFTDAQHDHSDAANGGSFSVALTDLGVGALTASELLRINSGGTVIESSGKTVPTGDIVGTSDTQTLTNKTLTSPILTTPLIDDGDAGCTLTSADQTNASPVVTIPDISDAADTLVMVDLAQTLNNKTFAAATFTGVQGFSNSSAPGGGLTDGMYVWSADIAAGQTALHLMTEDGDTIKLYQIASASQSALGAVTTVGSNTGTSGSGLSLIGDTTTVNQASNIMNDLLALQEDITAIEALVSAIRSALVSHGLIKGSA